MNTQLANTSQIHDQAFKRAVAILEGLKVPYAAIDALGVKHGTLEVKEPTKRTGGRKYPHGERSEYVRKYLPSMKVGDVVMIPFDRYDAIEVQSSATSTAHRLWGSGSVTTTINREKSQVEVLRIL
jgi:hypothetical protein